MYISTSVVFPPGISFAHPKSPRTTQVVGSFNRETNEMDLTDPKLLQEVPVFFPHRPVSGAHFGHILAYFGQEKSVPGTLRPVFHSTYNWKEHRLDLFLMLMIGRASYDAVSMAPACEHRQKESTIGCSHRLSAEIGEPSEAVLSSPLYCYEHRVASKVSCWKCVWCLNHWTPTRSMILIYTFRSLPTKVFFWFHCILQPNRPTGHCQRFWTGGSLLWVTLCLKIRAFATWKMVDMEREIFQDSNFQDGAESSRNRWVGTQHDRTYDGHRIYDEMWCRHHWPQQIWLPPRGHEVQTSLHGIRTCPLDPLGFVTSSGLSRLGHEAEGAFGVSRDLAMDFFGLMTWPYPWRIHGAAIYGNMDPINIPSMLAYIYIIYHTWILWDTWPINDGLDGIDCTDRRAVQIEMLWNVVVITTSLSWLNAQVFLYTFSRILSGWICICVCVCNSYIIYVYIYISYIIYQINFLCWRESEGDSSEVRFFFCGSDPHLRHHQDFAKTVESHLPGYTVTQMQLFASDVAWNSMEKDMKSPRQKGCLES